MKETKWYKLLITYIGEYIFTIILFLAFTVIFAVIFSLYNLNTEAVLYAFVLCLALFFIVFAVNFKNYYKKHKQRCTIIQNILLMADNLPKAETLAEADYQQMIYSLKELYRDAVTALESERSDSIDYYTTWVHQIKTPISVMSLILKSEDTDEHRRLLDELFRIEQYVEMVLCYFRLDSSSSDFVFKNQPLAPIIKQAVRKYAPQLVRKRIKLIYEPTDEAVLTDEKWLLFIIEQLLSNSVKYTDRGYIRISLSKDKILTIADSGIGIAKEDIPRIFEKGFTGYNGRADKKSTGLGLYLCKLAADKLSHRLSVKSEVGKGTEVSIDLSSIYLEVE